MQYFKRLLHRYAALQQRREIRVPRFLLQVESRVHFLHLRFLRFKPLYHRRPLLRRLLRLLRREQLLVLDPQIRELLVLLPRHAGAVRLLLQEAFVLADRVHQRVHVGRIHSVPGCHFRGQLLEFAVGRLQLLRLPEAPVNDPLRVAGVQVLEFLLGLFPVGLSLCRGVRLRALRTLSARLLPGVGSCFSARSRSSFSCEQLQIQRQKIE